MVHAFDRFSKSIYIIIIIDPSLPERERERGIRRNL
jgi:hypothetical protein